VNFQITYAQVDPANNSINRQQTLYNCIIDGSVVRSDLVVFRDEANTGSVVAVVPLAGVLMIVESEHLTAPAAPAPAV
jgi:hypothetical protein